MLVLLYFLLNHAGFVIPSFFSHKDKTHLIGLIFILTLIAQITLGLMILSRISKSEFDSDIQIYYRKSKFTRLIYFILTKVLLEFSSLALIQQLQADIEESDEDHVTKIRDDSKTKTIFTLALTFTGLSIFYKVYLIRSLLHKRMRYSSPYHWQLQKMFDEIIRNSNNATFELATIITD